MAIIAKSIMIVPPFLYYTTSSTGSTKGYCGCHKLGISKEADKIKML
jgi:hypothetical protein